MSTKVVCGLGILGWIVRLRMDLRQDPGSGVAAQVGLGVEDFPRCHLIRPGAVTQMSSP